MVNIAVLGYGTVGSGVVEVINTNHKSINKRAGAEINIKYVLDLRDFPGDPVQEILVHDYEIIANDPEVDIVVEVMGGIEPAYTFVSWRPGRVYVPLTRLLLQNTVRSLWKLPVKKILISCLRQAAEAVFLLYVL